VISVRPAALIRRVPGFEDPGPQGIVVAGLRAPRLTVIGTEEQLGGRLLSIVEETARIVESSTGVRVLVELIEVPGDLGQDGLPIVEVSGRRVSSGRLPSLVELVEALEEEAGASYGPAAPARAGIRAFLARIMGV